MQKISMRDLQTVATLGSGAFGQVMLVRYGGAHHALKALTKSQIVAVGLTEHVKREKVIMAECDCPFMVNLIGSFQDDEHIYMMMEAIMGGEFFSYLQV